MISLPYFDVLLEGRRQNVPAAHVFERFVHWGYWDEPRAATGDGADFARAMERMNAHVLALADVRPGQSVLDCGCGFGGTLAAIDETGRGMRLVGVNVDARQLAVATWTARWRRDNSIGFVAADACALPLAAGAFDRVLAVECIFHFPSRRRFLVEAARMLRPGGRLVVSDFVPRWVGITRLRVTQWIERQVARGYGPTGGAWSDGSYRDMAAAAGLEVVTDEDVTPHTLPTYRALLGLIRMNRTSEPRAGSVMRRPTRLLHCLSRLGLLRYRVLAFRKPA
jgi:SAM-dependent methyltransferase